MKWIFNVKSQKWGWVLTWFLSLVLYGFYAITSNLKNFATMISSGEKLSLVFKIPFLYTYFFIHISNALFLDRYFSQQLWVFLIQKSISPTSSTKYLIAGSYQRFSCLRIFLSCSSDLDLSLLLSLRNMSNQWFLYVYWWNTERKHFITEINNHVYFESMRSMVHTITLFCPSWRLWDEMLLKKKISTFPNLRRVKQLLPLDKQN